jgi:5-methylcytosine-specific restriction endonuclease McrBC regulatory subunit McrC
MDGEEEAPVVLSEHDKEQDTKLDQKDLDEEDIATLKHLKDTNQIFHSYDKDGRLFLTTNDRAGSFQLSGAGRRINIHPKMFTEDDWRNTTEFLNFADHGTVDYFEGQSIVELGDVPYLMDRLHITLVRQYDVLLREGLLKSYVVHTENSSSMRGKLLVKHQILNDAMLVPKFFCEFDELEYDTVENRVILQALTIVQRTSDVPERSMEAMDRALRLSGVVGKVVVSAPERQRMMYSYNRQTYRYKEIHETCEQIIREAGIEDIYGGDITPVASKLYDMDREFEKFVEKLFTTYGGLHSGDVRFQEDDVSWEGEGIIRDRTMKPDITIWQDDKCEEIIDVKYKNKKTIPPSDLYQLGFYMHEYGGGSIDHSFVIALESDEQKDTVKYTATISRKNVFVKRLNVAKCLKLIRGEEKTKLEQLVKWFVDPSLESFNYR